MTEYLDDYARSGAYDTPLPLDNRAGLDELRYRVGTFTSFRNSMLRRITTLTVKIDDTLPDGTAGNEIVPLRTWSARDSEDYGIALLELWAYVADILTFYQERVANEAFLRTANLRPSVARLAALLDYKPNPGVAASVFLTFKVKDGACVQLRQGLPVRHVPVADEKPQKFETSAELTAQSIWNQLSPTPDSPERLQFARRQRSTAVVGVRTQLAAGDWVLMVGPPRAPDNPLSTDLDDYQPGSERWDLRQLNSVTPNKKRDETTLTWDEGLGYIPFRHVVVAPEGNLFVLRGRAALFGYDSINWNVLHGDVQDSLQPLPDPPPDQLVRYDDWTNLEINQDRKIDLDREYPGIEPGSWIVLMNSSYRELYRVLRVETVNRSSYLISRQVTRLHLDTDENFAKFGLATGDPFCKVRQTVVLHTTEILTLASRVVATSISGSSLQVKENVSRLDIGRQIMVYGPTADKGTQGEVVAVSDIVGEHTIVLDSNLKHQYIRSQTTIFANVIEATHGETVSDEILGNGDASVLFQAFELKQSPLTFVSQPGAAGGAASTLQVRVNGIKWHEVLTFYGRRGSEAIYTVSIDDQQGTTILLGDGKTGALASSGRNNITASYRKGIGQAGNLPANVVKTLLERPKGLKSGGNLLPAAGGVEPESLDQIRRNAPNTVRTFGRIVSLQDFEDAAREYVGVAKARAFIKWDGEWQIVRLIVAGEDGQEIVDPSFKDLVNDLNGRRDPNRKMTVDNYGPVDLAISARVYHHADYLSEIVGANVRAVLDTFFEFDRLELGQSIAMSEIYHAIHQAEGVKGVEITRFRPETIPSTDAAVDLLADALTDELQQVVRIEPYQLARLSTANPDQFDLYLEAATV